MATVALVALSGCRAFNDPRHQLLSLYDAGNATAALHVIDKLAAERKAEQNILAMDQAVLMLMNGQTDDVVRELEILRRDLDYLSQKDVSEQIYSGLKDDTAVAWAGRMFERRMVDNIQLLSGILQNDSDVYAMATRSMSDVHQEVLESGAAQQEVPIDAEAAELQFPPEPVESNVSRFTAYLAAAVHSERMQDSDLTDRLIQQASYLGQEQATDSGNVQQLGTRTARGAGTLQVVTFSGRVTSWESEKVMPATSALLIADRILSAAGDHTLPATISAVQIARPVQSRAEPMLRTRVVSGGGKQAMSRVLIDVNENAWASYEAHRDEQVARAVVRRVLKKGAVYTLKNSLDVQKESGADFLLNLAGGLWESLEKADLRHCELLPAAIELAQLELPAGDHQVTLQVVPCTTRQDDLVREQVQLPVTIEDGRNTFVVCFRPRDRLVGIQSN